MLTPRQISILDYFRSRVELSSQNVLDLHKQNNIESSLITVKRDLALLVKSSYLKAQGKGRSVKYVLTATGKILAPINAHAYCAVEQDRRFDILNYDFSLFSSAGEVGHLYSEQEFKSLTEATESFRVRAKSVTQSIHKKELERFIIELSWKSSKIEGNTYSILDTERLIRDGVEAIGKTKEEAIMIINHKNAFQFVLEQKANFSHALTLALIEELHHILVAGLEIDSGLRSVPVGITGTSYRPLDNKFQIREAVDELLKLINDRPLPYEKSLLAQAFVPYIQPFEDGNKRTSRLLANALLIAQDCAPLSYRSVDENNYKEAILVFYELGNIFELKKIFIEQYLFAATNYNIKP